ncbi:MAG TPA: hypothetical protein VGI64_17325, partial [Streptosporangiaceae bacterium]
GRRVVSSSSSPAGAGHGGHRRRDRRVSQAAWLRAVWRRPVWLAAGSLSTVGAVLGAIVIPASASTAGDISIVSAGPDAADNPGMITVVADDGNGLALTSMTVNVNSSSNTVLPVQMSPVDTTNPASQTWAATNPIAQGQLAPGTYTLTVDAADPTESDTELAAAGGSTLAFTYGSPALDGLSSTPISFNNLAATISGALNGVPPWGADSAKAPVGIPGEAVNLVDNDDPTHASTQIAVTGNDGSFNAAGINENAGDTYQVIISPDTKMAGAQSTLTPDVNQDATRILDAAVDPQDLVYKGTPGMGSGIVQYNNHGAWTAPPKNFAVTVTTGNSKPIAALTTDNKGDFSFSMPTTVGTSWSVQAGGGPLLGMSTQSGKVHVAVPVTFASSSVTLDPSDDVTATACVKVTVANFSPPASPAPQLQTSQHRDGPWSFLANLTHQQAAGSCTAASESLFKVTKQAKFFPGAYYRMLFPSGINFQRALTGVVHQAKIPTAIQKATESPRTVKRGGKITFTGQLMQLVGGRFRPFGNQHIVIDFQAKSNGVLNTFCVGNPGGGCRMFPTNATGKFTATLADNMGTTKWAAQYQGGSKHFASRGTLFTVTVKGGSHTRGHGPPGVPVPDPPPFGPSIGPA